METVPQPEIARRIKRLQKTLVEEGFDGAFILQNTDLFYFTGTIQPIMLFVPAEGEAVVFILKNEARVRAETPLRSLMPIRGKSELPKLLMAMGVEGKPTIGLELDVLPANLYIWFRNTFPEWQWRDISRRILTIRMVKSAYEVEQIRRATGIMLEDDYVVTPNGLERLTITEQEIISV